MYLPMSMAPHVEKIQSTPTTPTTSSLGAKNGTSIIPLDAAITQKFSDVVYSVKLPHVRDCRSFLIPCPPPPSPVTPVSTPRPRNIIVRPPSNLVECQASSQSAINDTPAETEAEMNEHKYYEVNDPLEKLEPGSEVSAEDLNDVLNENSEYCNKIYNRNPWFQYIVMGDAAKDEEQPNENIPDATQITSETNDNDVDLEQFLESINHPPVMDPEEIKAVLGIDLAISPESIYFQCDQCSQMFATEEEILFHKELDEDCESGLIGTVVGYDLGQ